MRRARTPPTSSSHPGSARPPRERRRSRVIRMREPVTVACVQAEPAILDRDKTLDKVAELTAEAAGKGASLVVFPETFVPAYPSSAWAKRLAGWGDEEAK